MALTCSTIVDSQKKETKASKKMRRKYLVKMLEALTGFGALDKEKAKALISRFDEGYRIDMKLVTSKSRLHFEIDSKKHESIYI